MGNLCYLLAVAGWAGIVSAATPDEWRSRSIYQILTDRFARDDASATVDCDTSHKVYCGGNYKGVISRLDYIQGMGFDSLWISPITANIEGAEAGDAYHGYWQTDLYELNDHFGTAEDLNALSAELHARDMYLMVDIVVNHNGDAGDGNAVDYSKFNPFNNQDYYHPPCPIDDYDDQSKVEKCWISDTAPSLPDLKTEDSTVREMYNTWITDLVSNYSVDGLRIDTAKHVEKEFYPSFIEAAGVYSVGEVWDGGAEYTCAYQDIMDGVLNYPIYYPMLDAFKSSSGNMRGLASGIETVAAACLDPLKLGTFSENHDLPRFASFTQDMSLAKNIIAFTILADGIPIIYAGQEQHYAGGHDPANREALWLSGYNTDAPLYKHLGSLNRVRSHAAKTNPDYITSANSVKYADDKALAMGKGNILTVLTNAGETGGDVSITVEATGYQGGAKVTDVISCEEVTVGDASQIDVTMTGGVPRVFYPTSALPDSGLCGA